MSIKIDSLEVELFKGFKNSRVDFSDGLNLLVGKNNSGKTSLLQAIHLAFDFLSITSGISEIDKKRATKAAKLRGTTVRNVKIPLHEESYIAEGALKRSRREKATKIKISILDQKLSFMETATFPGSNLLVFSSDTNGRTGSNQYRKQIKGIVKKSDEFPLFIPGFAGVSPHEEIKMEEVVKFYIASGKSSEVLRNQLNKIPNEQFNELNEYLRSGFGVEIVSNKTKEIYLSSFYKERGKDYNGLDISSAGSGFQQVLQILVYIVTSNSDLILIDEPDAHLHFELQNILYDILRELVKSGKQIIVATHSPVFIKRALEKDDRLIITTKDSKLLKSINEYDNALQVLYEQGLVDEGDLTSGGSRKIISLEDSKDGEGFKVVKEFLDKLDIREPNFKIVSNYGSDEKTLQYASGKKEIEGVSIRLLAFLDSDSVPEEYLNTIETKLSKDNWHMIFLRSHEIENYLLNPTIISRALKLRRVSVSADSVKNMIFSIMRTKKDRLQDELLRSIEGKLRKYYEVVDIRYPDTSTRAQEIAIKIREMKLEEKLNFLPGKIIFNELKQKIHSKHGVLLSGLEIAKLFTKEDIPSEIKKEVKFFDK